MPKLTHAGRVLVLCAGLAGNRHRHHAADPAQSALGPRRIARTLATARLPAVVPPGLGIQLVAPGSSSRSGQTCLSCQLGGRDVLPCPDLRPGLHLGRDRNRGDRHRPDRGRPMASARSGTPAPGRARRGNSAVLDRGAYRSRTLNTVGRSQRTIPSQATRWPKSPPTASCLLPSHACQPMNAP